jgi:uncharacterized Tic20 family protein
MLDPNTPQTTTSDERTWALIAHLGSIAGLFLGMGTLGWLAPLIVWLVKKDSSKFVAFHALEELFFQIGWAIIFAIGWGITVVLSMILVGLLLIPVMIALAFVPIVWSVIAAIKANNGEWYEYPVVGQMALNNIGMARP